jgi:hypothetical protein
MNGFNLVYIPHFVPEVSTEISEKSKANRLELHCISILLDKYCLKQKRKGARKSYRYDEVKKEHQYMGMVLCDLAIYKDGYDDNKVASEALALCQEERPESYTDDIIEARRSIVLRQTVSSRKSLKGDFNEYNPKTHDILHINTDNAPKLSEPEMVENEEAAGSILQTLTTINVILTRLSDRVTDLEDRYTAPSNSNGAYNKGAANFS